jgi:predicted esterase YcpF (UPF0227 family)
MTEATNSHPVQIIYLHGFNSGFDRQNQKIKDLSLIVDRVLGFTINYLESGDVSGLDILIKSLSDNYNGETILVGTSLGGYFARHFSAKYKLRTILINPAVDPHISLRKAIGDITNYFTGLEYYVTSEAVAALSKYDTSKTEDTLMILATDDDVVPYQSSLNRYGAECKVILTNGGHRLNDLNNVIAEITAFINRLPASDNSIL